VELLLFPNMPLRGSLYERQICCATTLCYNKALVYDRIDPSLNLVLSVRSFLHPFEPLLWWAFLGTAAAFAVGLYALQHVQPSSLTETVDSEAGEDAHHATRAVVGLSHSFYHMIGEPGELGDVSVCVKSPPG
jgi:hypothetical protein